MAAAEVRSQVKKNTQGKKDTTPDLGRSREDYLEAILMVIREKGACRMTDVALKLNYSKPSVSMALKKLEEQGYIVRDDWRVVLTDSGLKIAEDILEKHKFFTNLLEEIGVEPKKAEDEACLVEHVISDNTFELMKKAWGAKLGTHVGKKTES